MYAEERHQAIAELVASRGRVAVDRARDPLRRDHRDRPPRPVPARAAQAGPPGARRRGLDALGDHARSPAPRPRPGQAAEKERIARAAVGLLPEGGGTLLIDAGSTTARLAARLPTTEHVDGDHPRRAHRRAAGPAPPRRAAPAARPGPHRHPGRSRARDRRGDPPVPGRPRLPRHQRHLGPPRAVHARPRGGRDQAGARRERPAGRRAGRRHQGRAGAHRPVRGRSRTSTCWSPTTASSAADVSAFEAAGLDIVRA